MKKPFIGLLLGAAALILAVALGLGFIHLTEIPYTGCIDALQIESASGLAREDILANYRSVMSYLSPFYGGEFSLASLAFSASGAYHFYECKLIFNAIYALGALSAAVWAIALIKLKNGLLPYGALGVSGCVTLLLPAVLSAAAINFDKAFVLFHKLFFNNDMWIFDERADPVITILPEGFFLACALVICAFLLLAAAAQLAAYFMCKRRATR